MWVWHLEKKTISKNFPPKKSRAKFNPNRKAAKFMYHMQLGKYQLE